MSKNLFGARLVGVLRERLLQRSNFWPAIEPATVIVLEQGLNAEVIQVVAAPILFTRSGIEKTTKALVADQN